MFGRRVMTRVTVFRVMNWYPAPCRLLDERSLPPPVAQPLPPAIMSKGSARKHRKQAFALRRPPWRPSMAPQTPASCLPTLSSMSLAWPLPILWRNSLQLTPAQLTRLRMNLPSLSPGAPPSSPCHYHSVSVFRLACCRSYISRRRVLSYTIVSSGPCLISSYSDLAFSPLLINEMRFSWGLIPNCLDRSSW
jgi:hypothetical protein